MTADHLRELAKEAEYTINYAFEEPTVAISQAEVLLLSGEIDKLSEARSLIAEVLSDATCAWTVGSNWTSRATRLFAEEIAP